MFLIKYDIKSDKFIISHEYSTAIENKLHYFPNRNSSKGNLGFTEGESSVISNSCNQCLNKTPITTNRKKQINEYHQSKIHKHKNKNNKNLFNLMPIKITPFTNGNSQKGSSKFKRGESSMSFNSCNQCLNFNAIEDKMKQHWKTNSIDEYRNQIKIPEKWLVKMMKNPFDKG